MFWVDFCLWWTLREAGSVRKSWGDGDVGDFSPVDFFYPSLDLWVIDVGDLILGWILIDVYTDPGVIIAFPLGFHRVVVFRCLLKTVDPAVAVEVAMLFGEGEDNTVVVDVILSAGGGGGACQQCQGLFCQG